MILFQVFVSFFALLMIYLVIHQRKRGVISAFESRVWLVLWAGFILLSFYPGLLQGLVHELHVSSVFDLLIVISLMIIVYVLISQRITILRLKKQLEEFVRQDAMNERER